MERGTLKRRHSEVAYRAKSGVIVEKREGSEIKKYSMVQKNSCMFEFPAFLPPTNLELLMHSPSALTEHESLNFAETYLLNPVSYEMAML